MNISRIITNIIEKRAAKTYKSEGFSEEYGVFIAIVIIVKIATSLFNAYAGFYMLKNYFISEFNNIYFSVAFTIIALVLLEFLVNYSLVKFFKSSFRGNIKAAIGLGLLSLVWFGASFLVSTNGLAQRHAQKADNSQIIIDKYKLEASEARKNAEITVNQALNAIETIKANPSGWRGGKRDVLQPEQLKQIEGFYKEVALTNHNLRTDLDLIETRKQMELSDNSGNVRVIEDRYYKTAIIIMILQFFVNGLSTFFYSKVYYSKHEEDYLREQARMINARMRTRLINKAFDNAEEIYDIVEHAYELEPLRIELKNERNEKQIGFKKITDTDQISNNGSVITQENDTQDTHKNAPTNTHKKNTSNALEPRHCKYCGNEFQPTVKWQLFCCGAHKDTWHRQNNGFDVDKYKMRKK
jgi:hypothetical protein